ncbi:MAG: hypothetical protein QOK20_1497, partial [Acidimicrobiaceae bacterium]|nr:hypothetical protein [Acidimicrobiaceae bacterium]MDQ1399565.1 hypothetical protein [Acidimicrobiaceae bacterium]
MVFKILIAVVACVVIVRLGLFVIRALATPAP